MDFRSKADNIITEVNNFSGTREEQINLITEICELYDLSMNKKDFTRQEIALLYYLSNLIGIPQYFDLFCKLNNITDFDSSSTMFLLGSFIKEASLFINKDTKVHIYQKELIDKFQFDQINRYLISASTSFGKTFIIFHLIEKMKYKNVALIFPTISLLSENLQRIIKLKNTGSLQNYNVITLSEERLNDQKNIVVFTPERFMTFLDKNSNIEFDFLFFDEVYKIDNDFTVEIDEETEKIEDSRDVAFRISLQMGIAKSIDVLLAGPFLKYDKSETMANFVNDNFLITLNYNDVILVSQKRALYNTLKRSGFDGLDFSDIHASNNTEKLLNILVKVRHDQSIVYCSKRYLVEDYALKISRKKLYDDIENDRLNTFIKHLRQNYSNDWCVVKALEKRIGIHHGTIPKYIQREMIYLFNQGIIKTLFSTTTITEGVNTAAKNMIILSHKKGSKELKKFDLLNIMGRAGRFNVHYSGRVFLVENILNEIINSNEDEIIHKNYGLDTRKTDVDLLFTSKKYLTQNDEHKKNLISELYNDNHIPSNIRNSFLMISPSEKVKLYRKIKDLLEANRGIFEDLIQDINTKKVKDFQFQKLIDIIEASVGEEDKLFVFFRKGKSEHSRITYMVLTYLKGGFSAMLDYEMRKGKNIDTAVRNTSYHIYTIFRYELVKHISVIDLIYKTLISESYKIQFDEISGFGGLLSYLEYGAYTDKGRKASDLGLPINVVKQIDGNNVVLDEYESMVYKEMESLVE